MPGLPQASWVRQLQRRDAGSSPCLQCTHSDAHHRRTPVLGPVASLSIRAAGRDIHPSHWGPPRPGAAGGPCGGRSLMRPYRLLPG